MAKSDEIEPPKLEQNPSMLSVTEGCKGALAAGMSYFFFQSITRDDRRAEDITDLFHSVILMFVY